MVRENPSTPAQQSTLSSPSSLRRSVGPDLIEPAASSLSSPRVDWWSVSGRSLVGHRSIDGRLVVGHRSVGGRLLVAFSQPSATPASSQSLTKPALAKNRPHKTDMQLNCAHKIARVFLFPVSSFQSRAPDIQHDCAQLFRPSALSNQSSARGRFGAIRGSKRGDFTSVWGDLRVKTGRIWGRKGVGFLDAAADPSSRNLATANHLHFPTRVPPNPNTFLRAHLACPNAPTRTPQ